MEQYQLSRRRYVGKFTLHHGKKCFMGAETQSGQREKEEYYDIIYRLHHLLDVPQSLLEKNVSITREEIDGKELSLTIKVVE